MDLMHTEFQDFYKKLQYDNHLLDSLYGELNLAFKRINRWKIARDLFEKRLEEENIKEKESLLDKEFDDVDALIEKAKKVFAYHEEDKPSSEAKKASLPQRKTKSKPISQSTINKDSSTDNRSLKKSAVSNKIKSSTRPNSKPAATHQTTYSKSFKKPSSGTIKSKSKSCNYETTDGSVKKNEAANDVPIKTKPNPDAENLNLENLLDNGVSKEEIYSSQYFEASRKVSKLKRKFEKLKKDDTIQSDVQCYKNAFLNSFSRHQQPPDISTSSVSPDKMTTLQNIIKDHTNQYKELSDKLHLTIKNSLQLKDNQNACSLEDLRQSYVLLADESLPVFVKHM